jgi:NAD-dependent dihydropyrimidine dehydrogenase PreA subunit
MLHTGMPNMAAKKLNVVISQAQGKNPVRRELEETIAARLMLESDIDVSLVPHVYDMNADHSGMLFLKSLPGDLVFMSWLYPRATRWVLDRQAVRGQEGQSLLGTDDDAEDAEDEEQLDRSETVGIGSVDVPSRSIYCIDLRASDVADDFFEEIRRIADERSVATVGLMDWIEGSPRPEQLDRYLAVPQSGNGAGHGNLAEAVPLEPAGRRWYPVIDYNRCTNCMECIDFCLFGVYGVDQLDRILVEEQDACKKGCPACSRVCPENAIIFPGHKTAAIAGADGIVENLKIDLSKLFGAPSAVDLAVLERDAELVADGRDAVGVTVGLPRRQTGHAQTEKDAMDNLMDDLDSFGD